MNSWRQARMVATHGLGPSAQDGRQAVAPEEWTDLLEVLQTQRLCGLAVQAFEDGALTLTPEQIDALLERHEMQLALDLRVERLVLTAFDALAAAGIEARLLKGPAVAHRFYADPSLRSFGDADILVRPADFRAALSEFERRGFVRRSLPPRPWFDRYIKAACLIAADGMELDLHQRFADGPFGLAADTDDMFRDRTDHVTLGDTAVPCLAPAMAFVHACIHAALGDPRPRFVSLRDVVEILRRDPGPAEVFEYVARCRLEAVVARALERVEHGLEHRPDGAIAHRYRAYRPSARDRERLAPYLSTGSRFERQSVAAFWALPSLVDKVAYAAALALPSRPYLRARGTTYPRRVRRAVASGRAGRPQ